MKLLSHRGMWNISSERNTLLALERSLENHFGFESDLRDYKGDLVISHDIANEDSCSAESVFQLLQQYEDRFCFAINIKSDGIGAMLARKLKTYHLNNYFCFDMSVPQMIEYAAQKIRFFTRKSEYEPGIPVLYQQAAGVWVDAFEDSSWITEGRLREYLDDGKEVCIVSPDLHGKNPLEFWSRLKNMDLDTRKIYLCTDMPKKAENFFEERLQNE